MPVAAAVLAGDGPDTAQPVSDAPVLRLAGYEGPLDALLDQARAGRVDLQRLPLLALIEQCVAALDAALFVLRATAAGVRGGTGMPEPSSAPLQRLTEWVTMAAWLTWLRSRLLLPADDPEARAARDEADAFRGRLARRAVLQDAADWLDGLPQLGRDVFASGAALRRAQQDAERAAAELAALLRAYTRRIDPMPGQGRAANAYSPRPPRLWRVPDAMKRFGQLLGRQADPEAGDGTSLWHFLPDRESRAAAGLAADAVPDPALLDRSAVASTFVAALELARQGQITLGQDAAFGSIRAHAVPQAALSAPPATPLAP